MTWLSLLLPGHSLSLSVGNRVLPLADLVYPHVLQGEDPGLYPELLALQPEMGQAVTGLHDL